MFLNYRTRLAWGLLSLTAAACSSQDLDVNVADIHWQQAESAPANELPVLMSAPAPEARMSMYSVRPYCASEFLHSIYQYGASYVPKHNQDMDKYTYYSCYVDSGMEQADAASGENTQVRVSGNYINRLGI